ncbi:proteoglycan 4-like [Mauremys reevesii]|uniref:proteoglycan 4-like n=1 Tax=Mauremys reevesii TaxID=260615 RepID=UPI00193F2CC4|nr:proteoglycan 4-like [Mauremys reevesii]
MQIGRAHNYRVTHPAPCSTVIPSAALSEAAWLPSTPEEEEPSRIPEWAELVSSEPAPQRVRWRPGTIKAGPHSSVSPQQPERAASFRELETGNLLRPRAAAQTGLSSPTPATRRSRQSFPAPNTRRGRQSSPAPATQRSRWSFPAPATQRSHRSYPGLTFQRSCQTYHSAPTTMSPCSWTLQRLTSGPR